MIGRGAILASILALAALPLACDGGGAGSSSGGGAGTATGGGGASSSSGSGGTGGSGGSCVLPLVVCGAACVDLATDPSNCGACDHGCRGAACSAGKCAPTALAKGLSSPRGIAGDADSIYYTDAVDGTVVRIPKAGGAPVTIASGQGAPVSVTVDAANVYWTNSGDGAVMQAPKGGGAAIAIAAGEDVPFDVAVDATTVYWVARSTPGKPVPGGMLRAAPKGGGAAITIASTQLLPNAIALDTSILDASFVYWTNGGAVGLSTGAVRRATVAGGAVTDLAIDQNQPTDLVLSGDRVLFTNLIGGTVMSVPASAGGSPVPPVPLASGQLEPNGIATDGLHVYWASSGDGTASRTPIPGDPMVGNPTPPLVLASGWGVPFSILVDEAFVYFTDAGATIGTGAIVKVAK